MDNNIDLDKTKINRLKIIIIGMVKENLKTKEYSKGQMTDMVKKKIRQEVLD